MNVYDRLADKMDKEIRKVNSYLEMYKDDKEMQLQLNAKKDVYLKVIDLIREDEFEWG